MFPNQQGHGHFPPNFSGGNPQNPNVQNYQYVQNTPNGQVQYSVQSNYQSGPNGSSNYFYQQTTVHNSSQQQNYADRIANFHNQVFDSHFPNFNQPFGTQLQHQPSFPKPNPGFGPPPGFGGFGGFGGPGPLQSPPFGQQPIHQQPGPTQGFGSPYQQQQPGNNPSHSNFQTHIPTNYQNPTPSNPSAHIPFNLQRANFTQKFSYQDEPDAEDFDEQTPSNKKDNKDTDDGFGPMRISLIQSTFVNNPYYYHQDHIPNIDQQVKPNEVQKKEEDEASAKEHDRLNNKVFAFFSQQNTDFTEFILLLGQLKISGEKYKDKDFPPALESLIGKNPMRKSEWGSCIWLRPEEFYQPGYQIFQGGIEPNDIKQGELGDCYFLSTLSSLAEWPNRIKQVFATKEANTCGAYCIRICDMGEWKKIIIDDYFPCDKFTRKPIFTKGNENELWVLILEKVWAKVYGSYDAIEAGLTRECLHDFTGAPTKFYLTDRREEWDLIWRKLLKGEAKQYAMTCGAGDFFTQSNVNMINSKGIVSSHAYSLLAAYELDHQGQKVRLVKLRNPWGKTEWKGAWSDSSPLWTSELKKRLRVENKDDGVFFMPYEDFLKYFSDIQFCFIHDDYKYTSLRVNSDPRHAVYFKLKITAQGKYYITVNQENKRKHAQNPHFRYSTVSIVVGKVLGNGQYEYVTGNNRADREVWAKGTFTPGEYLVYAKVPWTSGKSTDFVLSSYGPSDAEMTVVSKQSCPEFLEKTFITKARQSTKKMNYAREGEANCFSVVDISRDGFIYCYYQNLSARTLETEVYFKEFRGIKLRKPHRGRTFKIQVPPQQEKIVLLRILPNQDVKQVLGEKVRFITGGGGGTGPSNPLTGGGQYGYGGGQTTANVPNLDKEAKELGDLKRVKDSLTGQFTQVFIYQYKHDNGFYLLFENQTRDTVLDEKVVCELQGLEPIGKEGMREIRFELGPGTSYRIAFKRTGGAFDARFRFESNLKKKY